MLPIVHRVNSIDELKNTPKHFGIEFDLHAYGKEIIVHHDAFQKGCLFSEFLDHYRHNLIIVNIKEEGIEYKVYNELNKRKLKNFFFLDIPFPALIRFQKETNENRAAIRVSKYEHLSTALKLSDKFQWIFVDLMDNKYPISKIEHNLLKSKGYKFCLVSPELWKRNDDMILELKKELKHLEIEIEAILTKKPNKWINE